MDEQKPNKVLTMMSPLSQIPDRPKRYLYKPFFPMEKQTDGAGDPGCGKTKFASYVAGRATVGLPLFNIPCGASGNVVMFSTEDDAQDIKKTVIAAGGDPDKVFVLGETEEALMTRSRTPITLSSPIIEEVIKTIKPVLVVFDPIQRYIGGKVDINTANQTNAALAPLDVLGRKYGCAFFLLGHNNKNTNTSLLHRMNGSVDFTGNARSVLSIVRDPDNPEECIAIHTKTNNARGKSIRYRINSIEGDEDFACVEILGLEDYTEADYRKALKRQEAKEFEKEIDEFDPVVIAIKGLMVDNPEGVRLRKDDLHMVVEKYTDVGISDNIDTIVRRYRCYLANNHGILIDGRTSQMLRAFKVKGDTYMPSKTQDRNIWIRKLTPHTPNPPQ